MEPCNAVLCAHSLLEYTDVIIMMDNGFVFVSLYMGIPAVRSSKALSRAAVGPANGRGHLGRGGMLSRAAVGPANVRGHLGRGGTGTGEPKMMTGFQLQIVHNALSLAHSSKMATTVFLYSAHSLYRPSIRVLRLSLVRSHSSTPTDIWTGPWRCLYL